MAQAQRVFQVKVTLRGTRPPIWRRLEIPADMPLLRLHHVLQAAMGWYNCHLHQFDARGVLYGSPDPEFGFERRNERTTRLSDIFRRAKDRMIYEYDFGDGWEHDLVLEKILEPQVGKRYPVCTAGRRATPPEDCGGIGGFYNLLEIMGDPSHPEHADMKRWLGGEFDAAAFYVQEVNQALQPPVRSSSRNLA
jgi:Plasmid pRiA4b ORF-3-like protein